MTTGDGGGIGEGAFAVLFFFLFPSAIPRQQRKGCNPTDAVPTREGRTGEFSDAMGSGWKERRSSVERVAVGWCRGEGGGTRMAGQDKECPRELGRKSAEGSERRRRSRG